jgi:hypothetical protein
VGDALSPWEYATWSYVAFALLTLWWPLSAALRGVKLNPGGSSFSESDWFSDQAKKYLVEHYGRLQGTLGFLEEAGGDLPTVSLLCVALDHSGLSVDSGLDSEYQ